MTRYHCIHCQTELNAYASTERPPSAAPRATEKSEKPDGH